MLLQKGDLVKRTLSGPAYRSSRRSLLKGAVAGGAGLAGVSGIVGAGIYLSENGHKSNAAHAAGYQYNGESIQSILNSIATAKAAGVAFYTNAMKNANMLGWGQDMQNHVNAILVEEQIHVLFLELQGAKVQTKKFSFPYGWNTVQNPNKFLSTQQWLEQLLMSAHLVAIKEFGQMGRGDLAQMMGQMYGVDCEHRAWGRMWGGMMPMTNLVFEQITIVEVVEVITVLKKNGFMAPTNNNVFWYQPNMNMMGMNMNGMNTQQMQNMQVTPNMQMTVAQPTHF
jgi:hypothetical protein